MEEIRQENAELIDEISDFIIQNVRGRYYPIKNPEKITGGEFIQIPIKDTLGVEYKIAIVLFRSDIILPGNPIVLFAPGDNEIIDHYTQYNQEFCPYGVNFCVMDYRGRGYSEGEYITLGDNEIDDVFCVIRYLKNNGFEKISYFGRSRGAVCGLFAAKEFPELVSLALDSPRIHLGEDDQYISDEFDITKEKAKELLPFIYKKVSDSIGIDFSRNDQPCIFAQNIKQPIYIIHGIYDQNIPVAESQELINILKSEDKKLVTFKGGHNDICRILHFRDQFFFILKHSGADVSEENYFK